MFEIGRVVKKIVGRESGKIGVVVEVLDKNTVLIDGDVKRRKCSIHHLMPMTEKIELEKGASTEHIKKLLEHHKLILHRKETKKVAKQERKKGAKPKHIRKAKAKPAEKGKKKKAKKSEAELVEDSLAKV
ncbi:MAG: 50S ribosomal protein L14e [Candidatus Nanoarchaeia archaeon]|nr:50S ribosomal protein L14e [Candidatus Nanoarchaeia archaeon]MDD5239646.1 50S ribosomal protein L14e [Candidatus Nanoarchaeia archaeon]